MSHGHITFENWCNVVTLLRNCDKMGRAELARKLTQAIFVRKKVLHGDIKINKIDLLVTISKLRFKINVYTRKQHRQKKYTAYIRDKLDENQIVESK